MTTTIQARAELDREQLIEAITAAAEYAARKRGSDAEMAAHLLGALCQHEHADPRIRWACSALQHIVDARLGALHASSERGARNVA